MPLFNVHILIIFQLLTKAEFLRLCYGSAQLLLCQFAVSEWLGFSTLGNLPWIYAKKNSILLLALRLLIKLLHFVASSRLKSLQLSRDGCFTKRCNDQFMRKSGRGKVEGRPNCFISCFFFFLLAFKIRKSMNCYKADVGSSISD